MTINVIRTPRPLFKVEIVKGKNVPTLYKHWAQKWSQSLGSQHTDDIIIIIIIILMP